MNHSRDCPFTQAIAVNNTVARWPIALPNNSKQGGKKKMWPGKIGGRAAINFTLKWQKTGRKNFFVSSSRPATLKQS
jgi:hypothetical protein